MSSHELDRRLADLAAPRTRRGVLVGAGSFALAASLSRLPLDLAYGTPPRHRSNPFTLGVASGDPASDGVVLWTRLAPEAAARRRRDGAAFSMLDTRQYRSEPPCGYGEAEPAGDRPGIVPAWTIASSAVPACGSPRSRSAR